MFKKNQMLMISLLSFLTFGILACACPGKRSCGDSEACKSKCQESKECAKKTDCADKKSCPMKTEEKTDSASASAKPTTNNEAPAAAK